MTPILDVENAAKVQGGELIAVAPYPHPGDAHLALVIVKNSWNKAHEFVVWTYNNQDRGFSNGDYSADYPQAVYDFHTRLGKLRLS